jgi:Uma2 family endonuclease
MARLTLELPVHEKQRAFNLRRWMGEKACFPAAPEICVEVLSPGNTGAEIQEKAKLYFDAGAREVWLCAPDGGMSFLGPTALQCSRLCPEFPKQIQLR